MRRWNDFLLYTIIRACTRIHYVMYGFRQLLLLSLRATWNVTSAARLLVCVRTRILARKQGAPLLIAKASRTSSFTKHGFYSSSSNCSHFSRSRDIIRDEWIRNFDKSFSNGIWNILENRLLFISYTLILLIEVLYHVICIWNKTKLQNRSMNVVRLVQRNE